MVCWHMANLATLQHVLKCPIQGGKSKPSVPNLDLTLEDLIWNWVYGLSIVFNSSLLPNE